METYMGSVEEKLSQVTVKTVGKINVNAHGIELW